MSKKLEKIKAKGPEQEFHAVIERDSDGYYVGSVVELPGCHTQAKSLDTLIKRLKEAIELYLEVESVPSTPATQFPGIHKFGL